MKDYPDWYDCELPEELERCEYCLHCNYDGDVDASFCFRRPYSPERIYEPKEDYCEDFSEDSDKTEEWFESQPTKEDYLDWKAEAEMDSIRDGDRDEYEDDYEPGDYFYDD